MYSIDITKERLDEQDKKIIAHVMRQEWKNKRCLILGSGEGRIAIILALFGFEVVCVDVDDYSDFYEKANKLFALKKPMKFIQSDIADHDAYAESGTFSLVLAQRVLHYLRHENARELLDFLPKLMIKNSYLYVAVSCIDSAMGEGYGGIGDPVDDRFSPLSEEMQDRFSLRVPVCLYRLKELKTMMKDTHFKKQDLYQTSFMNIKGYYKL